MASGKRRTRSTMKSLILGVAGVFKRLQYPLDILSICERCCAAAALCLRHRKEMTGEPTTVVECSAAHYWAVTPRTRIENALRLDKLQSATSGGRTRSVTRSRTIGTTCAAQLITRETLLNSRFLLGGLNPPPGATPRRSWNSIASVILDRIGINLAVSREGNIHHETLSPVEDVTYPSDIAKNRSTYPPTGPPDNRTLHSSRPVVHEIRNMHILA